MADGTLRFVEDVYGVDGRQARLMRERLKGLRQRAAVSAAAAPAAVVP
jgi:hypothetical protein